LPILSPVKRFTSREVTSPVRGLRAAKSHGIVSISAPFLAVPRGGAFGKEEYMFGKLSIESWTPITRTVLIVLASTMLVPAAAVGLALMGLLLFPVALVAIPFMLSAFFGTAKAEREEAVRRSLRPGLLHARVMAT
jgi:hypothetical protein